MESGLTRDGRARSNTPTFASHGEGSNRFLEILQETKASQFGKTGDPLAKHKPGERVDLTSIPKMTQTTCIDLDITDGCNLGCGYCFKNLDKPNNMTLDTAKDSIEWLIRASGTSPEIAVNFMGGEPTLRFPALREIVRWGKRRAKSVGKRISFSFTSNMTLWTDEMRSWVDEEGIGVLMSIDGLPEVQDAQRPSKDGKPKAAAVARWVTSMLKTRPQAEARLTISPLWVHKLFESCRYLWEDLGFTNLVVADADYGNWTEQHIQIYESEIQQTVDYMFEDFCCGGRKSIAVISHMMKELIMPRDRGDEIRRHNSPCGAGYNYSMVDHNGDIWPCHRFDGAAEDSGTEEGMKLGNIYHGSYNDKLSNSFRNFDHSTIYKPACKTCPVEPTCGGFCPAANLQHNRSNIYKPDDVYCNLKWILYAQSEQLYVRMKAFNQEQCWEMLESREIGMKEV